MLAAGVGSPVEPVEAIASQTAAAADPAPSTPAADPSPSPVDDDHSETAWRLRHLRRGILKDVTVPDALLAGGGNDAPAGTNVFDPLAGRSGLVRFVGRLAANLFAGVPFTGQLNLLTTGSFDSPKQLFTSDNFSRSIAYFSLAAPVGGQADWSMHGALTQGDISSWFIAGAYATRLPARHRYDLGLSYSTQRYDGGNPAALREVTDGSRNVGAVYGFDTFTLTPAVAVTFGARVSRYDYLATSVLFSPRVRDDAVAIRSFPVERAGLEPRPGSRARKNSCRRWTQACGCRPSGRSRRSSRDGRSSPSAPSISRSRRSAISARSTVSLRAFRQRVDDQLVTMFGPR